LVEPKTNPVPPSIAQVKHAKFEAGILRGCGHRHQCRRQAANASFVMNQSPPGQSNFVIDLVLLYGRRRPIGRRQQFDTA
jgi:hypothetical protein